MSPPPTPKLFDVDPDLLRDAAGKIDTHQGYLQRELAVFKSGTSQLKEGQGWIDIYNDVIREVMKVTQEAIVAFGSLDKNLTGRSEGLRTTANNYAKAQAAARKRYAGLGGPR